ncbi:MAG: hypothetical protein RQ866_05990 [Bacteroidales bacterium]|nr:hypothetical protein [Bacteroidales bacterium]
MLSIIYKYAKTALLLIATIVIVTGCSKEDGTSFDIGKSPGEGKGGSLARFTIACSHLFIVDDQNLNVFDIANPSKPVFVRTVNIGFGIETIFPFKDYLLIGSNTGMYIYDLVDCANPQYVTQFAHVMSCDPVVAEGDYAYVTLRSGGDCHVGMTSNQLDILNIADINNPHLVKTYFMDEPWGLGIDDSVLFICHGNYGLGVYNVVDPLDMKTVKRFSNVKAYDVIPHNDVLIVTGPDGLYQYDYSDLDSLKLLSVIQKD